MTIGEKIRSVRKAHNMTQKDLASMMGVNQSHVSQYENDYKSPSMETLARFADALGCEISDLVPEKKAIFLGSTPLSGMIMDSLDHAGLVYSDDEICLIDSYRVLNSAGKEKLLTYASDLAQIAAYTSPDSEEGRA